MHLYDWHDGDPQQGWLSELQCQLHVAWHLLQVAFTDSYRGQTKDVSTINVVMNCLLSIWFDFNTCGIVVVGARCLWQIWKMQFLCQRCIQSCD